MPTQTVQATRNTTPNPDTGGNAVTGSANTGHAATTCSITGVGLDNKTDKWDLYPNINGVISAINVKFDWVRNGALGAGTSNGWSVIAGTLGDTETAISESNVTGASSGSVNFALSGSRIKNPAALFVADSIAATGALGQTATLTITISNLALQVTYSDAQLLVMW